MLPSFFEDTSDLAGGTNNGTKSGEDTDSGNSYLFEDSSADEREDILTEKEFKKRVTDKKKAQTRLLDPMYHAIFPPPRNVCVVEIGVD